MRTMQIRRHIPNAITSLNLLCGVLALLAIAQNQIDAAAILIAAALLFDFLDGFVARLLGVHSPVGKELDSLADAVTFGVVPGCIMALLIQRSVGGTFPPSIDLSVFSGNGWLFLMGLLISVFSVLRLARFNLDERQSNAFYGLATPANTLLVLSFWLITDKQPDSWLAQSLNHTWIWIVLSLLLSYLLNAEIKLIAFKFKSYALRDNLFRYILIFSGIILLAIFQYMAIPCLILLYFLLSILQNRSDKSAVKNLTNKL